MDYNQDMSCDFLDKDWSRLTRNAEALRCDLKNAASASYCDLMNEAETRFDLIRSQAAAQFMCLCCNVCRCFTVVGF